MHTIFGLRKANQPVNKNQILFSFDIRLQNYCYWRRKRIKFGFFFFAIWWTQN